MPHPMFSHSESIDMRQPYTLTSSLEVGLPYVKNGLKCFKMANRNVLEIQNFQPNFYHPTRSMEHRKQGCTRQNFVHANHAWIQE